MKDNSIILGIACALLMALGIYMNQEYKAKYEAAMANVKAYSNQKDSVVKDNTALLLTVSELSYYNDSILQKMDSIRKTLKVKDKNLQSVQYIYSTIHKTDTLQLRDTIFKKEFVKLDTIMQDAWYQAAVHLAYPNVVSVSPTFISQKYIVVHTKKETIKPPKKWWLLRLFQKKHTVLKVDIREQNPYIRDSISKYIEIVK